MKMLGVSIVENQDKLDLSAYEIRTDLAVEGHQIAIEKEKKSKRHVQKLEGVSVEESEADGIHISKINVETEAGETAVGKRRGRYLTIEAQGLRNKDSEFQQIVTSRLTDQLNQFIEDMGIKPEAKCLIIGLGNWNVTPDALGPQVVENIMVTSHLFELAPENVGDGYRSVSAISPGVMGITGIETSDIVYGIVQRVKPDFIIVVDALASRSIQRVNTTIQISDTGIHPGSGIGNKRKAISKETLGIPVIAIGVPTVVDAVSIVSDTVDFVMSHLGKEMKDNQNGSNKRKALIPGGLSFGNDPVIRHKPEDMPDTEVRKTIMGLMGTLPEEEKRQLIKEVLQPLGHHLIVTPKEVDTFVEDMANILANALNASLHQAINMGNVSAYTH
jgi:spore protease